VQLAACNAVTSSTTLKQDCYWRYWKTYLKAIELDDDPYLQTFTLGEQHHNNDVQDYKGASEAPPPVSGTI
jgi:hypothetical protein